MANNLPFDRQVEIISALTEGVSIRATERLTGVHRDTIVRLGARVGIGCSALHDTFMHGLQVPRIELDETWSFVGKKQARVTEADGTAKGDQWVYVALAGAAKAIIAYRVGKRTTVNTRAFVMDVRERVLGAPEISTDGYGGYPDAIELAFGADCTLGVIEKHYRAQHAVEAARRYSPADVVRIVKRDVVGTPVHICTSYVERQNLSLRMAQRRFTRLTNGFSKKLENHCAAVALYVAHYNFCRVHEALRITPAMQLGVTDRVWSVRELVDAALNGALDSDVPEAA
jgi:IS1 family transposase